MLWVLLESSHRDDSNDYPQHRVWKRTNGSGMILPPPPLLVAL